MDVRKWLRGLGLGQYGQTFRDNRIDADILADLNDGDLEKLGIPLGDRKRLLKAIAARMEDERGLPRLDWWWALLLRRSRRSRPRMPSAAPTVMFCDLVGSTSRLAARRGRLSQYPQCLSR